MGRSRFLSLLVSFFLVLLVSFFLVLLVFSPGFGWKMTETVQHEDFTAPMMEESAEKHREMIEVMDYSDPGPNTNIRGGYISPPPTQAR